MPTSKEFISSFLTNENIKAALRTIRFCEGTLADDGYNYIFGSSPRNDKRFTDMSTHPNVTVPYGNSVSTAAGAYQILIGTYRGLIAKYGLPDCFDNNAQDLLCLCLFDEIGVLTDISKGLILQSEVITKLAKIWASIPSSQYGQPTKSMEEFRAHYLSEGGAIG